jgi:hypothetical protein
MDNDYEAKGTPNNQSSYTLPDSSSTEQESLLQGTKPVGGKVLSTALIFFVIGAVVILVVGIPVTQVIIGSLHMNQCPINPLIPIYLIVAGVATLLLIMFIILKVRLFLYN